MVATSTDRRVVTFVSSPELSGILVQAHAFAPRLCDRMGSPRHRALNLAGQIFREVAAEPARHRQSICDFEAKVGPLSAAIHDDGGEFVHDQGVLGLAPDVRNQAHES